MMCTSECKDELDPGLAAGDAVREFAACGSKAEIHISTGSDMLNQFLPDFFSQACPFLFCGPLAMPDMPGQATFRRVKTSSPVDLAAWTTVMSRRVEHQWGASWNFSYLRWNYWFRHNLNRSNFLRVQRVTDEEGEPLTREQLLQGAVQITRALQGCLAKKWEGQLAGRVVVSKCVLKTKDS